jgi:hypothetical protein
MNFPRALKAATLTGLVFGMMIAATCLISCDSSMSGLSLNFPDPETPDLKPKVTVTQPLFDKAVIGVTVPLVSSVLAKDIEAMGVILLDQGLRKEIPLVVELQISGYPMYAYGSTDLTALDPGTEHAIQAFVQYKGARQFSDIVTFGVRAKLEGWSRLQDLPQTARVLRAWQGSAYVLDWHDGENYLARINLTTGGSDLILKGPYHFLTNCFENEMIYSVEWDAVHRFDILTRGDRTIPLPPNHERSAPRFFAVNDTLYFGGGSDGNYLSGETEFYDLWKFSPDSKAWMRVSDIPDGSNYPALGIAGSSSIAFYGTGGVLGSMGDTLMKYDLVSDRWTASVVANPKPPGYVTTIHKGAFCFLETGNSVTTVRSLDPTSHVWKKLAMIPSEVYSPQVLSDGTDLFLFSSAGDLHYSWKLDH